MDRRLYRCLSLGLLAVAALATVRPTEAQAFGDTCLRDVRAQGSAQSTMTGARNAAIAAWESSVRKRHGSRFANWYYSGDRLIDCSWNASGARIRCVASALPCGRST